MKINYTSVLLAFSLLVSCSVTAQKFEAASFWTLSSQNGYTHGSDQANRCNRGPLFMEDTQRWEEQNNFIPRHVFAEKPSQIRVVSYNVRFWTNPLSEPTRNEILKVIAHLNADILIMQEFDFDQNIYPHASTEELIKSFRSMGYTYGGLDTFAPIWHPHYARYGTVIFSKYPIINKKACPFSPSLVGADRQGYVHTTIEIGTTQLSVYGTHLAAESTSNPPHKAENIRCAQLQELVTLIESDHCDNAFIAADCNAVRKKDFNYHINNFTAWQLADQDYLGYVGIPRPTAALDHLATHSFHDSFDYAGLNAPKVTTWSSIPVDHFFLSPQWKLPLVGAYLFFSSASDHYPIVMDVKL